VTREASAVGAGLAPVREARPIRAGERIHVVGAAGAGASAAALLAHHAGAVVTGCDPGGPSPYTPPLEAEGIALAWGHDPAHVTGAPRPDRLAVTKALTAIAPDHAELAAARAAGISVEAWQQVVADAAAGKTLVGVAGTHGKSTTAGWLTHVLTLGGADPSAFVGALLPAEAPGVIPATARWGRGSAFVVEADEYAGNFDAFRPAIAVLTSAEWDHPDVFADQAAVTDAFVAWIRRMPERGVVVANAGEPGVEAVLDRILDLPASIVAYALTDSPPRSGVLRGLADRYATAAGPATALLGRIASADPAGTTLEIHGLDPLSGPVTARLATAGRHNAANALAVAGAALTLGLAAAAIIEGLGTFPGVGRRLERKGEAAGVVVYDDYGHHPTAIRETIGAIRQREPGRRVWAVYEPLTYHRTAALLDNFAEALATADAVAVADIWAGRDPDTTIASAAGLAAAVTGRRPEIPVGAPGSVEETADWLASKVRAGDAVLVMGGGRSYRIGERLLDFPRPNRFSLGTMVGRSPRTGRRGHRGGGSMAGEASFDVVSEFDEQELRNALDQVRREVQQRYDFKGVTVELTQAKDEITLLTDDEYRAAAVKDLVLSKAVKRGLSLKIFEWGKVEESGGNKVRQVIKLRQGLDDVLAKKLSKLIRDEFPKVKSNIQGDAVRVSGKSKDDLQRVIGRLRELDESVPLQFQNYR
jgi:UDP-N-acetylmuramate--alanine ligase